MLENEKYKGTVVKKIIKAGSKSEKTTHVLKTNSGEYAIRLKTSHLLYDPYFEQFEGKEVAIEGKKKISYLQVKNITEC
jgi:hypothetical protein